MEYRLALLECQSIRAYNSLLVQVIDIIMNFLSWWENGENIIVLIETKVGIVSSMSFSIRPLSCKIAFWLNKIWKWFRIWASIWVLSIVTTLVILKQDMIFVFYSTISMEEFSVLITKRISVDPGFIPPIVLLQADSIFQANLSLSFLLLK